MSHRLNDIILPWLLKQTTPVDIGKTFRLSAEEHHTLHTSPFLHWDHTGRATHVWLLALQQLHVEARTRCIGVHPWAVREGVHDVPGFVKHTNMTSSDTLHRFADGSVRVRTAYNIVSRAQLIETIRASSVKGVNRIVIIQEYTEAFRDVAELVDQNVLWSNGDRIWHKDAFAGSAGLDPFCTIVFNATENAVCTLRLVSDAIGCTYEAVEHAVAHLVECNKLRLLVPGAPFIARVTNTFATGCQTAVHRKQRRKYAKSGRKQWPRRTKLP